MSSTTGGAEAPQQNDQAEMVTAASESNGVTSAPETSSIPATPTAETTEATATTSTSFQATRNAQPFAAPQVAEQPVFSMPTAAGERATEQVGASHTPDSERRWTRPKTGPIVWGVLVLAFCVFTMFQAIAPGVLDGTVFLIAAVISLGLLLLAISAAVIVRSSRNQRR